MKNMKYGFTMVELIFVIVIIGILAAVAIPKLAATRDDAKMSLMIYNLSVCITDLGSSYTATGAMDDPATSTTCQSVNECFNILMDTPEFGTLRVSNNGSSDVCVKAQTQAIHMVTDHIFAESSISM